MKHINTINNCKSLYFLANKAIYTIEDEFQTSTFIDNVSFNRYLSILNLSTYNNDLYYFNNSELYKIVINKLEEVVKLENVNGAEIVSENTIFSWQKLSRKEYLYTIRNFDNQILWSFQGSDSLKCINGVIFKNELFDDTKFEVLDLKTGFPLWSYSLPEGFKISSLAQIIDNLLFFDAFKNANEEHFIVGLDINTGKIVWQHLYKIPYKEDIIAFTFNQKNKLCYAYLGNWYQIFNPISGEIIFEKKFDNDIDPYVNSVCDDKLWFVSGKYENCKFGYISLKTNEIEFLQDFPQENDEIFDTPIFHQNKLYLRGKYYNNLYIFEE